MQNIPTLRLSYANGILERLASFPGVVTSRELIEGVPPAELFKGPGPHTNPDRRAHDVLRHAELFGLVWRNGTAWQLTALGKQYLEAASSEDRWETTSAQAEMLSRSLINRAARRESFAEEAALALSLLNSMPGAKPDELARGIATVANTAWESDQTFRSKGDNYVWLLRDAGLWQGETITPEGLELLRVARVPAHPPLQALLGSSASGRWWWVNQGDTYYKARDGGFMWAPLLNKAGHQIHHWETMTQVARGDRVIHYRDKRIRAVSVVQEPAVAAPKPPELSAGDWQEAGRLVRTAYRELSPPINLDEVPLAWRENENVFVAGGSRPNQGYLYPLSEAFVEQMLVRFPQLSVPGETVSHETASLAELADGFQSTVRDSGLAVPDDRVRSFLTAAIAKRFVILTGLSGSGKTQLALRLGEWFGAHGEQERLLTVAVRPDWVGPEALFGYRDALRKPVGGRDAWFVPQPLAFLLAARKDPEMPYLMVLDEMNLAHVERYFSDFLSGIESRKPVMPNLSRGTDGEWRAVAHEPELVPLPENVFVVGTVNVDETTYMFSPKVLDRAFTFEIRTATEELDATLGQPTEAAPAAPTHLRALLQAAQRDDWHLDEDAQVTEEIADSLRRLHATLSISGNEFGHRVFIESLRFAAIYERLGEATHDAALDQILMLKVLPRIHGSRKRVEPVLKRLLRFAYAPDSALQGADAATTPPRLPLSAAKLERMLDTVRVDQFVSFTE